MLILQIFTPGVFAINNVFADTDKVNVCHWSDEDNQFDAINISVNGLNGHDDHEFDFLPGDIPEGETFDSQWCMDHATNLPPTEPETGSLTVTKVVAGTSTPASDFDLFVNGMPITSGVASTSIVVGSYTVTEEDDVRFEATFSGDCNTDGVVNVEKDENATCTITNTWLGGTGGAGEEGTFKVKILKYVDGSQATSNSADNTSFPFHASWDWTDDDGNHNSSGDFNIDQNGGIGGAPPYQAWTADMTAPADYAVNEVVGGDLLAPDAQCVPGKFRLQGYKTGTTLSAAQNATLSTSSPSFTNISSERYVIVYNENCSDNPNPTETATIHAMKVVCNSESDLPNWGGGASNITGTTASDYVASHPNCHLEPNWQFQWAPSGTTDPGMDFVGTAGSPWMTFGSTTTISIPDDNFVWVREVLQSGYIPFTSTGGGAPNTSDSAEFYCNTDVLNYDNVEFIDNIEAGHTYNCVGFNALASTTGTTTSPFMVKIYKYLDGVQATASTSDNYEFPMNSTWDWTDTDGNHAGTGDFFLGLSGHGGSDPYQAFTSLMTGPADYMTHEITSDIASSSQVLPIGAACQEGMFRLEGYKTGTTLAGALAGSLSTTSPSFTDISSERYIVVMNESCSDIVPTPNATGTIIVNKVVINDNGGTGTTTNFSFRLDNGSSTAFEADGSNSLVVATGTHNIVETAVAGYTTTYDGCSNISVTGGDTDTCTITNNDVVPGTTGNIIVNKIVINNNSGTSTASSFPLFVGTTSVVMGATTTFPLGTYTVSETFNSNLYAQSFSGDCNSSGVVTLSSTTTKTCTITNHDIPQLCPVTEGMIVSDTSTMVGTSSAALLSFIHPSWTADVDGASTSAKWIWSTNPVATTTATTTATFTRTFTVNGSSTSATLNIATDNTYTVSINGNPVGSSADGDNFTLATQDSYNVSNLLVDGTNTLTITVTNLPTPNVTDPAGNPAGLLYSLSWAADNCPVDNGGGGGGGGGEVAGATSDNDNDNNRSRSRTIVRGINSTIEDEDDSNGQVLGINTDNLIPLGQVLGITSTLPGLPSTGLGPIVEKAARSTGLPILIVGLLALGGLYVLQYRLLKKR
jgi:hypothetical protein